MIAVSDYFLNQIVAQKSKIPLRKIVIDALDDSLDVDISNHVARFGSISRALSFDLGRFSPGGHSLDLLDSKDIGEFLFHFTKQYGSEFWMGKLYNISIGFLNGTTEDLINVGTFEIYSKTENRINGRISTSGKDIVKRLNDFKVNTLIGAQTVFDYDVNDDNILEFVDRRSFRQVTKYGTHKLWKNNGDNKQATTRDNPFSIVVGFPNLAEAQRRGVTGPGYAKGRLWYFPFVNDVKWSVAFYATGAFRFYFWDYVDDVWRAIALADISGVVFAPVPSADADTAPGTYVIIVDPTLTLIVGAPATTNNWDNYYSGTDGKWAGDPTRIAPALACEFRDNLEVGGIHDPNPARVVYDLLTSNRLAGLPAANIDKDSAADFTTDGFTFDEAYQFLDNEDAKINVDFSDETTLLQIIEEISFATNINFFSSAKKSTSQDRRIKLFTDKVVNPCRTIPVLQIFSTRDCISGMSMVTDQDSIHNTIRVTNFDGTFSNKDELDLREASSGNADRVLQIGASSNPKAYLFNSSGYALATAQRLLAQFSLPSQIFNIEMDSSGFPLELTDYIQIHDEILNSNTTVQVLDHKLDLDNMTVALKAIRYARLYGPDELQPLKKWAFVDCALACTLEAPLGCGPDGVSYHAF